MTSEDYTLGKMVEVEIMNFLKKFPENQYVNKVSVLLFPTGLPFNIQRAIRYVAMIFDLIGIQVNFEGTQTVLVVRQHHIRPPYSENIDMHFCYEHVDVQTPYIHKRFSDRLKNGFTRHIKRTEINRTKFTSILEVMEAQSDNDPSAIADTTVEPSGPPGLNVYAKEFIPLSDSQIANIADLPEDLINAVQQYVGYYSRIVLAHQNYERFIRPVYNMNYIIELSHRNLLRRTNVIQKTYTEKPYYIKICNEKSLLVAGSMAQAQRMLDIRSMHIKARPFAEASAISILIAYYNRLAPCKNH